MLFNGKSQMIIRLIILWLYLFFILVVETNTVSTSTKLEQRLAKFSGLGHLFSVFFSSLSSDSPVINWTVIFTGTCYNSMDFHVNPLT